MNDKQILGTTEIWNDPLEKNRRPSKTYAHCHIKANKTTQWISPQILSILKFSGFSRSHSKFPLTFMLPVPLICRGTTARQSCPAARVQ